MTQQSDAFSQLGLALLAAILIVYIVMVATFRSLRQPLLLLVSVPFAATGAILLQIATGVPLGVASLIGVLMLVGIVVTNAIVLVDLVNQYREKGLDAHDATIAGGSRRLRPILMTALATIFALTPMALGITGHGGFISQPLAIVVIGGLVSSTVLTLLVLPTLYNLVEGARERRQRRREGGPAHRRTHRPDRRPAAPRNSMTRRCRHRAGRFERRRTRADRTQGHGDRADEDRRPAEHRGEGDGFEGGRVHDPESEERPRDREVAEDADRHTAHASGRPCIIHGVVSSIPPKPAIIP